MNWQSQYRFCIYLANILPRFAANLVAECMALINYICKPSERGHIQSNLNCIKRYARPIVRLNVNARQVYRSFAHICVDLLYETKDGHAPFIHLDNEADVRKIIFYNVSHKGLVLATCHLGHWELGAMTLAHFGLPISIVAETPDSKIGMQTLVERRQKYGVKTLSGKMRMRAALKELSKGRCVGIAADRLYGSDGRRASLFGKTCDLPMGPLFLAHAAQKPILLCVMIKLKINGKNIFRLLFEDPIMPSETDPKLAERALDQRMQTIIQRHLNEWCVFEKIFE